MNWEPYKWKNNIYKLIRNIQFGKLISSEHTHRNTTANQTHSIKNSYIYGGFTQIMLFAETIWLVFRIVCDSVVLVQVQKNY